MAAMDALLVGKERRARSYRHLGKWLTNAIWPTNERCIYNICNIERARPGGLGGLPPIKEGRGGGGGGDGKRNAVRYAPAHDVY